MTNNSGDRVSLEYVLTALIVGMLLITCMLCIFATGLQRCCMAWAGRSNQRADPRNRGYGAERGMHFEQTAHYDFDASDDRNRADRAVTRTPVNTVGPHEYDGHYPYTSCSEAGASENTERITGTTSVLESK